MPRSTHAEAILGKELFAELATTRILVVGAGGIGCELLKNVVLTGFGDITLLDLDTIDLSNLNRQFLFRKKDVKQSKAIVAARTAAPFNPSCKITPIHANIKDPQYDVQWFSGFKIVLNALDNLDARRHVNRMCMAANIPLIESGTAGYLGQVQPLIKDKTECFDCLPKPTPRTFPVCTIRSTPSTPIHCIVWAKSYLFPQLFGEEEEDPEAELDAAASSENAVEIANLKKEAAAFKNVRKAMLSSATGEASGLVFDKIFNQDIKRLLTMSDMWRERKPPIPLDRPSILAGTFPTSSANGKSRTSPRKAATKVPAATKKITPPRRAKNAKAQSQTNGVANGTANGKTKETNGKVKNGKVKEAEKEVNGHGLKDQKELTLRDSVIMFDDSLNRLAARLKSGKEKTISFDKDDDDTLDFVTATANLRAFCYGIPTKTRWEVKEMAGNIIPAIATTNAIISGLIVLQALHVIRDQSSSSTLASSSKDSTLRNVFLQSGKPSVPLGSYGFEPPNQFCGVCRETYISVQCDFDKVTLGSLVDAVLEAESKEDGEDEKRIVSVYEEGRILSDPDWDDNLGRTLSDLNCGKGKFVTVVDDDERVGNLVLCLGELTEKTERGFVLPTHVAMPPLRPAPPPEPSPPSSPLVPIPSPAKKRPAPEDDDDIEGPASKRVKLSNGGPPESPKKKRDRELFEQDGVIIVDDDDDDGDIELL